MALLGRKVNAIIPFHMSPVCKKSVLLPTVVMTPNWLWQEQWILLTFWSTFSRRSNFWARKIFVKRICECKKFSSFSLNLSCSATLLCDALWGTTPKRGGGQTLKGLTPRGWHWEGHRTHSASTALHLVPSFYCLVQPMHPLIEQLVQVLCKDGFSANRVTLEMK